MIDLIAEIGINHQGSMEMAKQMIRASKASGADVVKFQWYDPVEILGKDNSNLDEASKAQFTIGQHRELKAFCEFTGIEYLCSVFNPKQVQPLEDMGVKRYKIASRAALNNDLIRAVASTKKPVIVSTGLCDSYRLKVIARNLQNSITTFLYCICKYPTPLKDINLGRMIMLAAHSGNVGYSNHCPSIVPSICAANMGAVVIENHVVLSPEQVGCDVSSSLTFEQFSEMSRCVRQAEAMV